MSANVGFYDVEIVLPRQFTTGNYMSKFERLKFVFRQLGVKITQNSPKKVFCCALDAFTGDSSSAEAEKPQSDAKREY